ncbi:hypothetical protein, partial [Lysobacter sp. 22409]|uniref:hypothetical protein n=1 Tax=Lysobacter sp. 22409 TaxID=3453917 RepID=UPI003F86C0AB
GIFHTGHPCPDEKRPASMRAALRVFDGLREFEMTHSNSNSNSNPTAMAHQRVGAASYWISFGHKPRPRNNNRPAPVAVDLRSRLAPLLP